MTLQIAIIGLGQIGASIGLALAEKQPPVKRVGHDKEFGLARQAEKRGALDKVSLNLHGAIDEADIVILALPMDQVHPVLEVIAPDLRENCVIFDTSPVKSSVLGWAKELLPPNRHYIGLTPVLNGLYLQSEATGIDAARPDLFKNGLLAIVNPPGTPEAALRLATDLAAVLGAEHMFVDPVEVDSLMAALHILPQLMAAALVQATIRQPGWMDGRKLTGRPFAEQTHIIGRMDKPAALAASALQTPDNTMRVLDNLIQALYDLRDAVQERQLEKLTSQLEENYTAYLEWLGERLQGQWTVQELTSKTPMPSAGDVFGRMIGVRSKNQPKEKPKNLKR